MKKYFIILTFITIISIIIFTFAYFEISQTRKELRSIAINEIISLLSSSKYAIENNLLTNDLYQEEVIKGIVSSSALISHLPSHKAISKEFLKDYCESYDLDFIAYISNSNIISNFGKIKYTSLDESLKLEIMQIVENDFFWKSLGVHKIYGEDFFLIGGLFESESDVILGGKYSAELLQIRKTIGIGKLLDDFKKNRDIKFAIIQDTLGIISATKNITNVSPINSDTFLIKTLLSNEPKSRIIDWNNDKLLEGVIKIENGKDDFLFRLYLSLDKIRNLGQRNTIGTIVLSLGLFLLSILAVIVVNNRLKHQEVINNINIRNEKLESLSQLAAGVAHEIRNPMNAISMIAQRFNIEFEPVEDKEEFDKLSKTIIFEIKRINVIITQFLEFATIRHSELKPNNLNLLMQRVLNVYDTVLKSKKIEMTLSIPNDAIFKFDFDKIEQVLINLVQNAVDSIGELGQIKLKYYKKDQMNIIELSDTGNGIKEEICDKIFNIYFTTKNKGSGLGLAIVSKIVNEHKGKIYFETKIGKGSTFFIELPD